MTPHHPVFGFFLSVVDNKPSSHPDGSRYWVKPECGPEAAGHLAYGSPDWPTLLLATSGPYFASFVIPRSVQAVKLRTDGQEQMVGHRALNTLLLSYSKCRLSEPCWSNFRHVSPKVLGLVQIRERSITKVYNQGLNISLDHIFM